MNNLYKRLLCNFNNNLVYDSVSWNKLFSLNNK